MNNASGILDEKSSKNIDKIQVYGDIDGIFDCTLIKYADDNQIILDEIQITIINEQLKYSLLLQKLNNESTIDLSNENIELVKGSGSPSLRPYRYLKDFENLTIDTLNYSHHVNYKSISIGHFVQESSIDNQYTMHEFSTLSGPSGSLILDSTGRFVGIHIGVVNSRKEKKDDFIFNKETFNKFIPVNSTAFREFIHQTILPNINDDEVIKKWLFNSK